MVARARARFRRAPIPVARGRVGQATAGRTPSDDSTLECGSTQPAPHAGDGAQDRQTPGEHVLEASQSVSARTAACPEDYPRQPKLRRRFVRSQMAIREGGSTEGVRDL